MGCAPPTPFFCPHARKISEAFVQRSGKKDGCDASTTVILTLGPLPFPCSGAHTCVRRIQVSLILAPPSAPPTPFPNERNEASPFVMKPTPPPGPCRKRGFYRKEVSAVPFDFVLCAGWKWIRLATGRLGGKGEGVWVLRFSGLGWFGSDGEEEEECTPAMYRWEGRGEMGHS